MLISPIVLSHCRTEVCTSRYTPLCVYSLLDPPRNCCFDEEIEPRPSPHLPLFQAIFQLCFSISFWSFFILSLWVFFLIVSSASFAFLPTPMCGIYYLGAVRIFLCFNSAIFFIDLFHNTSVPFVFFYSTLALCRNSPQPKCNAQIEDYSHCPVLTYSYSHG